MDPVESQVNTLRIGGSSGTQTLAIVAMNSCNIVGTSYLQLFDTEGGQAGLIGGHGVVELSQAGSCPSSPASYQSGLVADVGTLTNRGTILTDRGDGAEPDTGRALFGSIANTGRISIKATTTDCSLACETNQSTTIDNKGSILLANGQTFYVAQNRNLTIVNDRAGVITNTGTGQLYMDAGNAFVQGDGTISSQGTGPTGPAVIVNSSSLDYTGTGAGTLVATGSNSLSGNISATQALVLEAVDDCSGALNTKVTPTSSFTNAGTIRLTQTGSCGGGSVTFDTAGSVLTNSGTLDIEPGNNTPGGTYRALQGDVTNLGTLRVNAPSTYGTYSFQAVELDNLATLTLGSGDVLDVPDQSNAVVANDTGGTITNAGGSGHIYVDAGNNTYEQGSGTTSSSTTDPPVEVNGATIDDTGGGSSTIEALSSDGTPSMQGDVAARQQLVVSAGTTLDAAGFTNSGRILLDPGAALKVSGAYSQEAAGQLVVGVASSGAGALNVNGSATLGGELSIHRAATYEPAVGTAVSILSCSSLNGAFSKITGTSAGVRPNQFLTSYGSSAVALTVTAVTVAATPSSAPPGATTMVTGSGFSPGETVTVNLGGTALSPATADSAGTFSSTETVPNLASGKYSLRATGGTSFVFATGSFTVK